MCVCVCVCVYVCLCVFNPLKCFFRIYGLCSTRYKPGTAMRCPTLAIDPRRSACPHGQFHTLHSLLDSWAALINFYPNVCVPSKEG